MHNLYKSFFISVLCCILWSPVMKAQVYPAGFAQQAVGGGLACSNGYRLCAGWSDIRCRTNGKD